MASTTALSGSVGEEGKLLASRELGSFLPWGHRTPTLTTHVASCLRWVIGLRVNSWVRDRVPSRSLLSHLPPLAIRRSMILDFDGEPIAEI